MKTMDFFHQYGRVADVILTPFVDQINTAVANGWLTPEQGMTIVAGAAQQSADTVQGWTPDTPAGYAAGDTDNPLADLESPCAKLARRLANQNDEDFPEITDFPERPQGEGQQAHI